MNYPAEWEKHEACWIIWPCRLGIWPDYECACRAYAEVIHAIARFETVNLIVPPALLQYAKKYCNGENIVFLDFPVNDSWSRDTLPIFLKTDLGFPKAVHWKFNAWGNKFSPYDDDVRLGHRIAEHLGMESIAFDMVLEGGAVHTNGQGTLMTTKQCLLNRNRNPAYSQHKIEETLKQALFQKQVLWLEEGLEGDLDTDGHIDNCAAFISSHEILIQASKDPNDPNTGAFEKNKKIIEQSTDLEGRPFVVHEIPQPPAYTEEGKRLPLSYINFYFANDALIVPKFLMPTTDDRAYQIFRNLFPKKEIIAINALPLVQGGGGIHCITMQQPKGTHEFT